MFQFCLDCLMFCAKFYFKIFTGRKKVSRDSTSWIWIRLEVVDVDSVGADRPQWLQLRQKCQNSNMNGIQKRIKAGTEMNFYILLQAEISQPGCRTVGLHKSFHPTELLKKPRVLNGPVHPPHVYLCFVMSFCSKSLLTAFFLTHFQC